MRKRRLPPLAAIRTFDAVARHASFKLAAEEIGVTATAVSHQIRVLEEALDTRLFQRSAKAVTLTAAGEILLRASGKVFTTLREAVEEIAAARRPASLTLSTTSNFLSHWLVPRLPALKRHCPQVELRLHSGTELVDVRGRDMDAAIRYAEQVDPDLDAALLYQDRFLLLASPALNIRTPADLTGVPLFHIENRHIPQPEPDWAHWRDAYGPADLDVGAGIRFDDEAHAVQAAIAGQGVVIASQLLVQDALEKRLLVAPLIGALPGGRYYFVTGREKASRDDIRQLRAWLLAAFPAGDDERVGKA
ncbi:MULTISPECIES: LysR substrate-binding domain-containing protein [Brenneria]|uniref:LysR family transcriptional regulator n=1 Tax=Brenneria nigrifluens DSM 30175 = ATCC 13028 TaxID=1121120 RepID=A0A2U1USL6_9GAMM|nr:MULTISPECIES: LysR substrate-binding domain-containing protein [Brenneria]PWC24624.1 LysR family transcriptional regulator [Brenneria nigrifluens DSM 30175 = ATCC 13028]QCR06879.1 LysR family transcriptional regulator [Brenneria nigrifluens DSM 30175 = ATCC 13028]